MEEGGMNTGKERNVEKAQGDKKFPIDSEANGSVTNFFTS